MSGWMAGWMAGWLAGKMGKRWVEEGRKDQSTS